jgi:hypothetical protein
MAALYTNNASTILASSITNSATSLTVASGQGSKFPNPTGSDYFLCTLQGASGTPIEIVKVTSRSTDTFTIVRAQEGTTASAFNANDIVELRITAGEMTNLPQLNVANTFTQNQLIAGATSGAITLAVPSIAGTNTATFPAATGTVMVSGNQPAFSAYGNTNQTISSGVNTKVIINTETFDTNNNFDSTTNYRFTPTVAGYYQINAFINFSDASYTAYIIASIYKNGSAYKYSQGQYNFNYGAGSVGVSDVVYFNGSTDYVEFYARQTNTSAVAMAMQGGSLWTYMSGVLVRAA